MSCSDDNYFNMSLQKQGEKLIKTDDPTYLSEPYYDSSYNVNQKLNQSKTESERRQSMPVQLHTFQSQSPQYLLSTTRAKLTQDPFLRNYTVNDENKFYYDQNLESEYMYNYLNAPMHQALQLQSTNSQPSMYTTSNQPIFYKRSRYKQGDNYINRVRPSSSQNNLDFYDESPSKSFKFKRPSASRNSFEYDDDMKIQKLTKTENDTIVINESENFNTRRATHSGLRLNDSGFDHQDPCSNSITRSGSLTITSSFGDNLLKHCLNKDEIKQKEIYSSRSSSDLENFEQIINTDYFKRGNDIIKGIRSKYGISRLGVSRNNKWGQYSYKELIVFALIDNNNLGMPVCEIYEWIIQHIPYFQNSDPQKVERLKNSIRHNLSLHKDFIKSPTHSGKSGIWKINTLLHPQMCKSTRRQIDEDSTNNFEDSLNSPSNISLNEIVTTPQFYGDKSKNVNIAYKRAMELSGRLSTNQSAIKSQINSEYDFEKPNLKRNSKIVLIGNESQTSTNVQQVINNAKIRKNKIQDYNNNKSFSINKKIDALSEPNDYGIDFENESLSFSKNLDTDKSVYRSKSLNTYKNLSNNYDSIILESDTSKTYNSKQSGNRRSQSFGGKIKTNEHKFKSRYCFYHKKSDIFNKYSSDPSYDLYDITSDVGTHSSRKSSKSSFQDLQYSNFSPPTSTSSRLDSYLSDNFQNLRTNSGTFSREYEYLIHRRNERFSFSDIEENNDDKNNFSMILNNWENEVAKNITGNEFDDISPKNKKINCEE